MFSKKYLPHQEPNEYTVLFLRRHWFVALKTILFFSLLAGLPLVLYYALQDQIYDISQSNIKYGLFLLGASTYYIFIWLFFFHGMLDFYLDVWIITNKRIISIEQKGLFARVIAEQRLARVQDVTSDVKGFFPTLLRYGQVYVQTAGAVGRFIFKQVPDARGAARQIIVLANKRKRQEGNQPPI